VPGGVQPPVGDAAATGQALVFLSWQSNLAPSLAAVVDTIVPHCGVPRDLATPTLLAVRPATLASVRCVSVAPTDEVRDSDRHETRGRCWAEGHAEQQRAARHESVASYQSSVKWNEKPLNCQSCAATAVKQVATTAQIGTPCGALPMLPGRLPYKTGRPPLAAVAGT